MKRVVRIFGVLMVALVLSSNLSFVKAQEWSTGLDVYSSYIWRGAKFGSGPAFQPYVDFTTGGFSIGAWGSVNSSLDEAFEMDLYAGYSFDFGLGLAVTDYYFGGDWTAFDSLHWIEPMVSYEIGGFSVAGAYMFTPGFDDGDTYLELGYSFENVSLTLGMGDGAYTATDDDPEGGFNVCNLSVGTSKEIEITEKFSLPVSGSVTLNPATGGFYIAVGVSF